MEKIEKELKFCTLGSPGLVVWAICTNLDQAEAIEHANRVSPTGISSRWQLSDEKFPDGEDNPHVCPDDSECKHYLLNC